MYSLTNWTISYAAVYLGRYVVGHTVGNLVLVISEHISDDRLLKYDYPHSNAHFLPVMLCFFCFKFDPTKCDVNSDDILFFVSISRIHYLKFLTLIYLIKSDVLLQ